MKLTTTLNKIRACGPCTSGWQTLLKHVGKDFDPDAEINLLTILESNSVADMLWTLRATDQDSKRVASQLAIEFAEQALPIFEKRRPNDERPRKAIQAARDYLDGKISLEELRASRQAGAHTDAYAADAAYADAAYAYAAAAAAAAAAYAYAYAADAAAYAAAYAADAAYAAAAADAYAAYAADAAAADAAAAYAAAAYAADAYAAAADAYAAYAADAAADAAAAREKALQKQAEIIRTILEP